ncbi:MAG: hypothetical protein JXA58_00935 [Dehalococcoidia bacterium]|nr:hypothetical protein [Dehalococcoidia bacterium]
MRRGDVILGAMVALSLLTLGTAAGCTGDAKALDAAYERGFAEGVSSVADDLVAADEAYQKGYEDGLAAAVPQEVVDACQRCYGQGYSDGYQAAIAGSGD